MATEVVMPQMGESIAEGTITRWLAKAGDRVVRDQPLFEISTDKVDAEIPSPVAGVLLEVLHQEGETVPVNRVVAYIGEPGEKVGSAAVPAAAASAGAAASSAAEGAAPAVAEAGATTLEERLRKFSSPLVRSIAAKEGVEIAGLEGSGVHGRVTKKDILAHLEQRAAGTLPAAVAPGVAAPARAVPAATAAPPAPRAQGDFHVPAYLPGENVEIVPMSNIRRLTAAHMAYSKATSAHVSTVFHIDMSRVAMARDRARAGFLKANGTKLTYMPFIFRAVTSGLRAFPQLNASIDGTNVVYKKDVNLGIAVALQHGLIVPVIKNADQLSLVGLARAANDLADRARSKKLRPEEVQGGTFTITNPGVFGSLFGTPVINQPQVAILGIGTVEKRPVVITDETGSDALAIRTMCYFAITFDHRLIDGADADHFMNHVKRVLETDRWSELDAFV